MARDASETTDDVIQRLTLENRALRDKLAEFGAEHINARKGTTGSTWEKDRDLCAKLAMAAVQEDLRRAGVATQQNADEEHPCLRGHPCYAARHERRIKALEAKRGEALHTHHAETAGVIDDDALTAREVGLGYDRMTPRVQAEHAIEEARRAHESVMRTWSRAWAAEADGKE